MSRFMIWVASAALTICSGVLMTGCGGDGGGADMGTPDMATLDMATSDEGVADEGVSDLGPDACSPVGATRVCGSDLGECVEGTQTCGSDFVWGACEGGVRSQPETCNGLDDDCDGVEDNGVLTDFWLDSDTDGRGDPTTTMSACAAPTGYVANDDDCDDTCITCYPGGTEVCDGSDNDCNSMVDDGVLTTYYQDMDSDTRGNPNATMMACSAPSGYVSNADDCNDLCNVCWTGNPEVCDGFDNNCAAGIDEGVLTTFYRDADSDTRGTPTMSTMACAAPTGYVANSDDCDDACNTCWTGNTESCDALDNNCAGGTDEGFACVQGSAQPCTTTCGTTGTGVCSAVCLTPGPAACTPPAETCNSIDEDCDSLVDEGLIARTGQSAVALGADAKLANGAGDYVAFQRRNAATYLYRVGTDGAVRNGVMTLVDSSGAVSVDIDRASDTQWLAASTLNGTGVQTRLVGLNGSGDPAVTFSRLVADTNADGVARVAINSVADGRVLYQAGPAVRTAAIVSLGATTATTGTTLPGTQHRPELGMDIVSRPGTAFGYVIAWVAGASPQVHIAYIISGTVSGDVVVGAGSNPSLDINDVGIVGVTYTGIDNRPRFHSLLPGLNCVNGGGAPNTCAQTLGTLTVNAPPGGFISQRTLDIAADGRAFWVTARVSDGEQVYRVSNAAVHDDLHRAVSTTVTTWMSVGAQAGRPLVLRGNAAGYTHDTYGCL